MSVNRLSPLCLVLILASSALGTYPWGYPEFGAAPLSFGPHLIYGPGIGGIGNADLTGYSYFTKDLTGGKSEVVFFMGPDSDGKLNDEVAAMKNQMSSSSPSESGSATESMSDEETKTKSLTDNQNASEIPPLVPVDTKEAEATPTTATPMTQDKNEETLPEGVTAGFGAPYPIIRLGGSAAFYPHIGAAPFSGYTGYGPSDYFRSQYVPFVNNYNSYQNLYNPLYPSFYTDYSNPASSLPPTIYHNPIFFPPTNLASNFLGDEKTQGDSSSDKNSPTQVSEVQTRIGGTETTKNDQKTDKDTSTEKATDLPTTTEEQMAEKSTTATSEISSTTVTAQEVTETTTASSTSSSTTAVVDDAVAVE